MVKCGLDKFLSDVPKGVRGKNVALLCHAASVNGVLDHASDLFYRCDQFSLQSIFGPQHGLFGQTQDNMIEWEGGVRHPVYDIPIYSLYGEHRKPTREMLEGVDAFVIDLQDVGARPYTYIWTIKLCLEACGEQGIAVYILDRPNPIAPLPYDGDILSTDYYTFVGGAEIPLCHRMTIGEMGNLLQKIYYPSTELHIVTMDGWNRDMLFSDTKLPWVLPSPNMPTLDTAIVYPGMVLFEALNVSEGRGTTRPFEIFGAPFIQNDKFLSYVNDKKIPGVYFREHNFIPTFNKWQGEYCYGFQIHVTDPLRFESVYTAAIITEAIIATSPVDTLQFKAPPYEYEYEKLPFDILAGSTKLRETLEQGKDLQELRFTWQEDNQKFDTEMKKGTFLY